MVESAPSLRTLAVQNFEDKLNSTDIAERGPYPLIKSLGSFEGPVPRQSPFIADHTLPSLLVSWAPNLRSLIGSMPAPCNWQTTTAPVALPPSLERLEINGNAFNDPRIDTILLQAQPSLHSLTLAPSIAPANSGWASSPALSALLSSVESFSIDGSAFKRDSTTTQQEIDFLARAIAPSSSLRHLGLVPGSATLIAALPPSLQSITFLPAMPFTDKPRFEMDQVLELLKAAGTHPLRIEFLTAVKEGDGRVAWEQSREGYAAEGHTLSVRCYY